MKKLLLVACTIVALGPLAAGAKGLPGPQDVIYRVQGVQQQINNVSPVVVTTAQGDYLLVVDGKSGNPGPSAGFISVRTDGQVCFADNGRPDDGYAGNGAESTNTTCSS